MLFSPILLPSLVVSCRKEVCDRYYVALRSDSDMLLVGDLNCVYAHVDRRGFNAGTLR